jgi:RNA polymerase sigma-70 factor (ECF subfamily)
MAAETPTSWTLLDRLRGQEADAWSRLLHLYGPLVQSWCRCWHIHGPDAEDVVQEVFQAVSAGISTFRHDRPDDTFRGWLKGIARHKMLDWRRRRQQQVPASGGTEANALIQQLTDPIDEIPADDPAELRGLYRRALELVRGEFEAKTWQAFWRVTVDGVPTAVVSQELELSTSAVRMAKSRILRRLREEIGDVSNFEPAQ